MQVPRTLHNQRRSEETSVGSDTEPRPSTATSGGPGEQKGQFVKLLLEAGPLVIFFVANSNWGIFPATGAFMVATIAALAVSRIWFGRIPVMPLVSGFFVLIFGALTLYFHEEFFIKIKPTIVNSLFSIILFGGLLAGHALLRHLFGEVFNLRDRGWWILTFRW
ncbi:MAG: septation protein IspZ, partial [Hyphomicrobiaceae bacterium]|nr:septation protein IspZ [Hyphomicrobiaceae bacterium]